MAELTPKQIDRVVEELKKEWSYIDIDAYGDFNDEDWIELVEDVLRFAKEQTNGKR